MTTLDFAAIRQQCPRAFTYYIAWNGKANPPMDQVVEQILALPPRAIESINEHFQERVRDLYDFFDVYEVYASVRVDWGPKDVACFGGVVETPDHYVTEEYVPTPHPTRADAETAAFGAAFERFEVMINQKEGWKN